MTKNTASPGIGPAGPGVPQRAPRTLRADAHRNIASLLEAAKAVFATAGVHAPAKEIADLAGVGVGTLYRHFPQRSDLVKAVFQHEVDACADAAPALAAAPCPATSASDSGLPSGRCSKPRRRLARSATTSSLRTSCTPWPT